MIANTKTAVGYVRMSTNHQEASPEQQRTEIRKLAKTGGYKILRWYEDHGITGDSIETRPEFSRMLADAQDGDFRHILCWDLSRFGRFDVFDAGVVISPLRKVGVGLVTVADGVVDWDDFAGQMVYMIHAAGNNKFLKDLSRNVTRGQLQAALAGSWIGKAPYGYRVVGKPHRKRLEPNDPNHRVVVERIYTEYDSGTPAREITRRLNVDNLLSPTDAIWNRDTVGKILRNPAYVGDYVYNRKHSGKYHAIVNEQVTSGVDRGWADESDWIVHRDHWPAMIDRAMWDRVQVRLSRNASRKPPVEGFALSSLVRCGRCDHTHAMWGRTRQAGRYYVCGDCGSSVRESILVDELGIAIGEKFNPRTISRLEKEIRRQLAGPKQGTGPARKRLDAKLAKLQRRLVRVDDDMVDIVQEEIRSVRGQLEQMEQATKTPKADVEAIVSTSLKKIAELPDVLRGGDYRLVRRFLGETLDHVDVWTTVRGEGRGKRYHLDHGMVYMQVTGPRNKP